MKAVISAALCVLFAATGAASAGEGVLGRLFGGGDRSGEVPKSIWQREKDASGTHLQTGLKCPVSAGAFKLTGLLATDAFGFDVWCQYDTTTRERITVFLTRRQGESLEDHFEGAKTAITTTVASASLVGGGEPISFTTDPAWLSAVYDEGRLRSGVWVTDFSGWTFKFRATYPPAQQQAALDAMSEIAATASMSAGTHLAACAAAPMPERGGQRVTRTTDTGTLLGTLGTGWILGQSLKQDTSQPVWCMEKAFDNLAAPIQGWRNIAERSDGTPVQRFTLMTVGPPPTFDLAANPFVSSGLNKARNETDKFRAHVLAVVGGNPAAFAFFDGEPDMDAVAGIVDSILASKEQPVVYINRQGTVVINLGDPDAK